MELMIASSLVLLLLSSCGLALRSAMGYYRRIEDLTAMENSLLTAATLLTREAAETAKQAVHYEATPPQGPSLTFPIPRDSSGTLLLDHGAGARLLFGSIVSYRILGSDEELRRYIQPLATAVGTPPHPLDHLTPPRDAAYYAPVTDYRVLAKGVKTFTITGISIADWGSATSVTTDFREAEILRLTLELERQMGRRYGVSMEMDLVPKN